jgi:hypothetical protein
MRYSIFEGHSNRPGIGQHKSPKSKSRTMQHRRAILTEQQAIEIFGFRFSTSLSMTAASALVVAKRYSVNERTVRDIWNLRTWANATLFLAGGAGPIAKEKMGRPLGSKDVRPRKEKHAARPAMSSERSTSFSTPKGDTKSYFDATEPTSGFNASPIDSDWTQQKKKASRMLSGFLMEPSDESDFLGEEEPSIDDHLHIWAHGGPQWIINAPLLLDGELQSDCELSIS